jgi:hypothetical protein
MGILKTVAAILIAFFIIGLMTTLSPYQQAHAQTSPLTEDQDGKGYTVLKVERHGSDRSTTYTIEGVF